jgi:hypothetical protein
MNKIPIDMLLKACANLSYEKLVQSYGYEIVQSISLGSYQGDIVMIVSDTQGQYGLLVTGYGSCSGCDALCACYTNNDYEELRETLCGKITLYSCDQFIEYLDKKDWAGEYYGGGFDEKEFKDFLKSVKEDLVIRHLAQI